jgi:early secretory antigenic target protein ESAT-6
MADNDFVHVHFGSLSTGQNDFAAVYQSLQGTLGDLESELNASLGSWTDDAKEAYRSAQDEWNKLSDHMAQVLQKLGAVIGTAHENYTGTEKVNAQMW